MTATKATDDYHGDPRSTDPVQGDQICTQSQYTQTGQPMADYDHDHDCDQAKQDQQDYYEQNHNGDDDDDFSRLQQPNKENWRK